MQNAWNVLLIEEHVRKQKKFEGDSPKKSGAIDHAKELRSHHSQVFVISRRRGFPPPLKKRNPPRHGLLWCPYCIEWREFEESSIERPDYVTPALLRCVICTISIKDGYVRKYNPELVERLELAQEMKRTPKKEEVRRRRRR